MSAFENANAFFVACETAKGWAGCKQYVAENSSFSAQSEPIAEMTSIEEYCEWMAAFGTVTAPGAYYDLNASSYDESTRTALFFGTYNAKHTGEGGPVPPTGQETHSHYVYSITMDENDKVLNMIKIWNAPWAMRELGWA
ncbi:MAG: hypothetical protein AB8B48_12615 [Pseudomonadales bacterium]